MWVQMRFASCTAKHAHTHTHTYTHKHIYIHTRTQTHTHTCTYVLAHTHKLALLKHQDMLRNYFKSIDPKGLGVLDHKQIAKLVSQIPGIDKKVSKSSARACRLHFSHQQYSMLCLIGSFFLFNSQEPLCGNREQELDWFISVSRASIIRKKLCSLAHRHTHTRTLTHVQECKFILSYLYQCGRKDGQLNFDSLLTAVRAFGLGRKEEDLLEEEVAKWQVHSDF